MAATYISKNFRLIEARDEEILYPIRGFLSPVRKLLYRTPLRIIQSGAAEKDAETIADILANKGDKTAALTLDALNLGSYTDMFKLEAKLVGQGRAPSSDEDPETESGMVTYEITWEQLTVEAFTAPTNPSILAPNVVTATIDGTPYPALVEHFTNQAGHQPAEVLLMLPTLLAETATRSTLQGKTCVIQVDGVTKFTGHVWNVPKRWSDGAVHVLAIDRRMFINKSYVGATLLETLDASGIATTTNGLRVLGSDLIFNKGGKPNKDAATGIYLGSPVAPAFIHMKGSPSDPEDCSTTEAAFWTYGDLLYYLWTLCVTDVANPINLAVPASIISSGGLAEDAGEFAPAYLPIGEAIDQIFERTRANWCLDGTGAAYIFTQDDQRADFAPLWNDPATPLTCDLYTTDYPAECVSEENIAEAVTQVDIIGGQHIRQIKPVAADWYAAGLNLTIQPSLGYLEGTAHGFLLPYSNCGVEYSSSLYDQDGYRIRWVFKHDRYEAHSCGRNIRPKDLAKPMLGELLFKRDRTGQYRLADDECGIYGVGVQESLMAQYPGGAAFDGDRFEVIARYNPALLRTPNDGWVEAPVWSNQKPTWMVVPVILEYRCYKSATGTLASMPTGIRRAVLRDEFVQQTTEAVDVPLPFVGEVLSDGLAHVLPQISIPSGWTGSYPTVFDPMVTPLTPTDYVLTTPAGVIVDALAELNKVVSIVTPEVAKAQITVQLDFPTWKDIEIGTKLTAPVYNPNELSGNEMVVAWGWEGRTQKFEASCINRLGAGVQAMAQAFVDGRSYRKNVSLKGPA